MGVNIDDIVSFEMTAVIEYKNCEVTIKKFGKILDLTIKGISDKGYLIEKNKDFICKLNCIHLLNYINENTGKISEIYNDLIEEGVRNDNKIKEFKAS